MIYRDFCNTCGAAKGKQHESRCHLTGEVVAWAGAHFLRPAPPASRSHLPESETTNG